MGKKRKNNKIAAETRDEGNTDPNVPDLSNDLNDNKKPKKHKKTQIRNTTDSIESNSTSETLNIEDSTNTNREQNVHSKTKKKKKKTLSDEGNNKLVAVHVNKLDKKPTKIRFIEEDDEIVPAKTVQSDKVKKTNNNKSVAENEEEEVKDEEIDKFCDELTEEDNVQFDNWVKLIEAKLHSKKNK